MPDYVTREDLYKLLEERDTAVEEILNRFQRDMISSQSNVNLVWNVVNVVIRALTNIGVLKESDVVQAGKELAEEHAKNVSAAKYAAAHKRMPLPGEVTPTPMEQLTSMANSGLSKRNN